MTAPALEQLEASAEEDSASPAPDPEILWLIRLASIGVILLGAAVFWNGTYPAFGDFIFKNNQDYMILYSADYLYDRILFPLIFLFSIKAGQNLIAPRRANLRYLSLAYCTFISRATLKVVMSRYFNNGECDDEVLSAFIFIPTTFSCGYFAHRCCVAFLRHRGRLNSPQRDSLALPVTSFFKCFVTFQLYILFIYFSLGPHLSCK